MTRLKHSAYLFLGKDLKESAALMKRHLLKCDNDDIVRHFTALSWIESDGKAEIWSMERQDADRQRFYPDEEYLYQVAPQLQDTIGADQADEQIRAFFDGWFQTHVTVDTAGANDAMQLTIVMQAFDDAQATLALKIASLLNGYRFNYDIDILLLAPDTHHLFIADEKSRQDFAKTIDQHNRKAGQVAARLLEARQQTKGLQQIILLQSRMKSGASFDFTLDTLIRIVSEYAMVCIENNDEIHTKAVVLDEREKGSILGLGLSCLDFDKHYFLNYLLHHAYLYIMEREGVPHTEVDINRASILAKKTIKDRTNVLTDFYEQYVQPEINKGTSDDDIMEHMNEHLTAFVDDLKRVITAHIKDDNLSLPEKLAVIAQILIIDEDTVSGHIFDKGQPSFIDFFREPIHFFIDNYNESLEFEVDENGDVLRDKDTGIPVIKNAIISGPQDAEGHIHVPIDEIKHLRMEIRQASEYIRSQTEQLEHLEKIREESHKVDRVVVDDENYFRQFRLIEDDIKENPLEENYEPKPTKETNVDLSHDFTPVKNQGAVGSCTTFAVTAVYESILKKNSREDHDLSERFLYYNAREADGRLDKEGVAISTAILSVHGKGICQEEKCLYSETEYNQRPSEEAYLDAEARKIKTAMNIVLCSDTQKNRDALRSAVAEGYPVVISLKLFDAFDHIGPDGMVPIPSPDDQLLQRDDESGSSSHAMVICGFDDKNEVFLVRNSWGEKFGKEGYCFIPYAYMCDHEYLNNAYIITEVTDDSIKVKGLNGGYKVMLDMDDINVKIAIIRNTIAVKKKVQAQLIEAYNKVYAQYEVLLQTLLDPDVLDALDDQTSDHYGQRAQGIRRQIAKVTNDRNADVEAYDKATVKTQVVGWIFVALTAIVTVGLWFLLPLSAVGVAVGAAVAGVMALWLILYANSRKEGRNELLARYDELLNRQNLELGRVQSLVRQLPIRSKVTGKLLKNINDLHRNMLSLRNSMRSYINNLYVWYGEEQEKVNQMDPAERPPFVTLLDNDTLNRYFEQQKDELTRDMRLYNCWDGVYEIDETKIFEFKNDLKQQIKHLLAKGYEGFCVYDYIAGNRSFAFLADRQKDQRPDVIRTLDNYSGMLLQPVNTSPSAPFHYVYVKCDEKFTTDWRHQCEKHTDGGRPLCGHIFSPFKLLALQLEYISTDNIAIFNE